SHASGGSRLNAAARTVGDGAADADAELSDAFWSLPPSEPESEEQPAATSITGTAAAATRTRGRRRALAAGLDAVGAPPRSRWSRCTRRCMVPSLMTLVFPAVRIGVRGVTVRGAPPAWSCFTRFTGRGEGSPNGGQPPSESASREASSLALSCISSLSGATPTAAGCSAYWMVTMTLDVRNATVTVRSVAVGPELLSRSSRNASSPRSSSTRCCRAASGAEEDEGDEEEEEDDEGGEEEEGDEPGSGEEPVPAVPEPVAVGSGSWAASRFAANSVSAWLSSLTLLS